jgi:hypothetical protein
VKRSRRFAILIALTFVIGIPGAALGQGGPTNCVGESAHMLHTWFRNAAQSEPGGVRDMIASFRTNPEAYPWCG